MMPAYITRIIDVECRGMHSLQKKHCGYSRARLDQTSLFGCRTNCVGGASFKMYKDQRKPWHGMAYTMKNGVHATVYRTLFRTHWHYSTL